MSATITEFEPVVWSQADAELIFLIPHRSGYDWLQLPEEE